MGQGVILVTEPYAELNAGFVGLEHFYAAFGLDCSWNLWASSTYTLGISEHAISEDCSVLWILQSSCSPYNTAYSAKRTLWHKCFPLDFTGALFFVPS